jgi:hypothetical protein
MVSIGAAALAGTAPAAVSTVTSMTRTAMPHRRCLRAGATMLPDDDRRRRDDAVGSGWIGTGLSNMRFSLEVLVRGATDVACALLVD